MKIDFLGLRTLTILQRARELVRRRTVVHALDTLRRRLADWKPTPEERSADGGH